MGHEHRWALWENVLEVLIGVAVISETLSTLWLRGFKSFVRDCWCLFDALVVVLTVLDWGLLLLQRAFAHMAEKFMADVDLPLFTLRFILQPFRLLASLSMVRRVTRMQKNTVDINFDVLERAEINVQTSEDSRIMTPELRSEVTTHLPVWCRFRPWDLLYSPHVHGTSMQTFFRHQAGPNLVVLRDAKGHIFGGFSEEPWRIAPRGYRGTGESFVFTSRPLKDTRARGPSISSSIGFYHATGEPDSVLFWADSGTFALSNALVIRDDFRCGSSEPCPAFGSPALTDDGLDFVISDFECWGLREDF